MRSKYRVIQEIETDEDGLVSIKIVKTIDIGPAVHDDDDDDDDEEEDH